MSGESRRIYGGSIPPLTFGPEYPGPEQEEVSK